MAALENEGEFNEEEKMDDLDLGLGTPSSLAHTPSYLRVTPSG